jgi:hypothetical protein
MIKIKNILAAMVSFLLISSVIADGVEVKSPIETIGFFETYDNPGLQTWYFNTP